MSYGDIDSPRLNRRDVLKTVGAASAAGAATSAGLASTTTLETDGYRLDVLSSSPDQVSGGDALVEIEYPDGVETTDLAVFRNDASITDDFEEHPDQRAITGVVDELDEGENTLSVESDGQEVLEEILVNHPKIGPIFSGANQQPFACTADEALDTQLKVDTEEETGIPVEEGGEVIGYSIHCRVDDQVDYVYRDTDGDIEPFDPDEGVPDDAATVEIDGDDVPYLIRWERGTINRFIYSFAILDPGLDGDEEPGEYEPDEGWNGKLVYHFQGGVGIGHTQGRQGEDRMLRHEALSQGYAVAYSTGTRTGDHYNMQVGGETALMVKEEFIIRYGTPEYTIGLGGSGGGIQQYLYGQNHPGLIDGAIPRVSYPDMATQTIHTGDCELLEYFMDVLDGDNEKWDTWDNRSWLIGLNAVDDIDNPLTGEPGASECTEAWRGLTPLAMNPNFGEEENWDRLPEDEQAEIERTHWDDARQIYGVDDDGYARRPWDNVGVQYGLQALKDGNIDKETFLMVNGLIGGWKPSDEMVQEGFPFVGDDEEDFDPWSARNMTHEGEPEPPEPRVSGDTRAMTGAYEEGLVFDGEIDIPVIDWRPYMEDELDMHNTHQSFAARKRIMDERGADEAEGHVVWFTDADGDLEVRALAVMDEWLSNLQDDPDAGLEETRPAEAVDACFENDGLDEEDLIAAGEDVWNGIIDEDEECGECAETYPTYTSSRIEAGGPITGAVFKCQLQPVEEAIERGVYGDIEWSEEEVAQLHAIFPHGVCDYTRRDAGYPHPSGLPRGVWDSVSVAETTITPGELAAAEDAFEAGEELARMDRAMTEEEWDRLSDWAETNVEGPQQIAEEFDGPPTPAGFDDGLLRDVNGDGVFDITDVQDLFENLHSEEVQGNAEYFNFSRANPDRVTVFDLQALFTDLQQQG